MTIKEFEIQLALGLLTYEMKVRLANNLNTPIEVLTKLSADEHWAVRWSVAKNTNTPTEALTILSTDEDWCIRCRVANNTNTPTKVLEKLSVDNKNSNVKITALYTLKKYKHRK